MDIDARLGKVLALLREKGAVEAYRAFNNDHQIRYLGGAFFTKVLYFAGGESEQGADQPIILDSLVSRALQDLGAVDAKWPKGGWTTDQYQQYVLGVREAAARWGVLPDQVEAALFLHGKKLGAQSGAESSSDHPSV